MPIKDNSDNKDKGKNNNKELAKIFSETARLLEIKGNRDSRSRFRIRAYKRATEYLKGLEQDIFVVYKKGGLKGLDKLPIIGKSLGKKIEEYLKMGKIKYYDKLKEETAIRQIVTCYFESKGLNLNQIKNDARKRKIIYSRFTRPAKQLLELAGSVEKAKKAIDVVAKWANSRGLDYAIETVFKKWLELDRLKPKEIVKKPFYQGKPMVWSQTRRRWYVIDDNGEWLEFADKESKIEWRVVK